MTVARRLVVIGGGAAGMAAAVQAARHGMRVTVIDEHARLGGQYFRGRPSSEIEGSPRWFAQNARGVLVLNQSVVVDTPQQGTLTISSQAQGVFDLAYDALVLATGAYDRPVPLPGWTLPGVFTAGGASTLAKAHGVTPGKRVLVAGAGPFLLSVADDLAAKGCAVQVVEATPFSTALRGLAVIGRDREILQQTVGFLARLARRGVKLHYGAMVTRIEGMERVARATIQRVDSQWHPLPGTAERVEVDAVCLGFGFVPQLELAQALGCQISYRADTCEFLVHTDDALRTSISQIYAAGEITGIGGVRVAIAEGQLAGLTAALDTSHTTSDQYAVARQPVLTRLAHLRRVAEWVRTAYRPRDGLWTLADETTMLCRCEDVSLAAAQAALAHNPATPYAVKTATRLGMGLCQGRICHPALIEWLRTQHQFTLPHKELPWRIRPPLRPVPLADWLVAPNPAVEDAERAEVL